MNILKSSCLVFFTGLFALGADKRPAFAPAFQTISARAEYLHANWGIAVTDLASGEMLYQLNEEKLFAPASTTKLFSSAAALIALGANYRFVTPVYRTGTVDANGKLSGNLVIKASGDPSLSGRIDAGGHLAWTNHDHTYAGDESNATLTDTDVLSGLKDLAQQVANSGIKQVHDVAIDDRLFDKAEGSGSGPSQLVPIVVNDNVFDVMTTPASSIGTAASVTLRPVTQYAQFDSQVATVDAKQPTTIDVEEISPGRYTVRGQIGLGHAPALRVAEVSNAADFARTLFIECLKQRGVMVERSALAAGDAQALPGLADYAALTVVAKHTSPPFAEQLKVILKVSHNLAASLLPLLVGVSNGGHDLDAGMKRQGDLLKQVGVDVGAISFAGGAGGTRADYVTPRVVTQLLRKMAAREDFAAYNEALPVLGVDGTLVDAVGASSPALGKVYGKTGTLVWENTMDGSLLVLSKAMAGYMTSASGRNLVFSIYLNNVQVKTAAGIEAQGKALGEVAELIYGSF